MKKLLFYIITLFAIFSSLYVSRESKDSYKVLNIISPTEIFIDTNQNNIYDETTPISIENINFINKDDNYKNDKILKSLTEEQKFFLDYFSKEFAFKTLKNRYVKLENNQIIINNKSYESILISSNLFYTDDENSKQNLINYINKINLDDYYLYNISSKKLHKLSCKSGRTSKRYKIIKKSEISELKNATLCTSCNTIHENTNNYLNEQVEKVSKYKDTFEINNIKVFFIDLNSTFTPNNKCNTNVCKTLKDEINSAQSTIDFAIYGINNQPEIIKALLNAEKRGVKLRFVCDYDKKDENYYPDTKQLKLEIKNYSTDEEYEKTNKSAIMHNKFFIFDNKKVWTGSANITSTDLSGFNANYAILINSPELAKYYTQEFEQMYNGKFHTQKEKFAKQEITVNNIKILPLFSPKDNGMKYLIEEIKKAKNYIYMPIFYITNKDLIEELIAAQNRKVDIKIINDATNAHAKYTIHKTLRENGIEVKTENFAGKMHMKSVFIDDKVSIIGSMNFTKSGNNYNDENMLIIQDEKITKYLKGSFLYLWKKIPDKYLTIDPYAESYLSIGSCTDGIDNDFDGKIDSQDNGCTYKK